MAIRVGKNLRHFPAIFALALVGLGWIGSGASADVITFEGGEQLQGQIYRQDGESIAIRLISGGEVVVDQGIVRSVVKEPPEMFFVRRGDLFLAQKEYGKALVEYLQADQRRPGQSWIEAKIAQVKQRRAEEICEQLLQQAEVMLARKAYRQAINVLMEASRECPEGSLNQEILRNLAITHSVLAFHYFDHCFEELALEELAKAEEYYPQCANVYYVLGRINHSQNRFQTARREYERALEIDPDLETARDSLLRLERDFDRVRAVF